MISSSRQPNQVARQPIKMLNPYHILEVAWITGLLLGSAAIVFGQSPPQGPPVTTNTQHDVGVGLLTGIVKTVAQSYMDSTNANLKREGTSARVSLLPLEFRGPSRTATLNTSRPNEWIVRIPITIGIKVDIPNFFDRRVYVPLDLDVSCDRWHTGAGVIKVTSRPGPPSFEGGSWLENAPGLFLIRDYINSLVRTNFPQLSAATQTLGNLKCGSLGVSPAQTPNDRFAAVLFDFPVSRPPRVTTTLQPTAEVTFLSLKRLVAYGANGTPLYDKTERIFLETYVNFTVRQSGTLTMNEGDVVTLKIPPVVMTEPFLDPLVVIANISYLHASGFTQDSAFDAFPRSTKFSPGAHTLRINKVYFEPPSSLPGHQRPVKVIVPAYELTYRVRLQEAPTLSPR